MLTKMDKISNSKRIAYVDFVKGIAIMLMVLCHSGLHGSFSQWVYSFHMPLFFIVSGFLVKDSSKQTKAFIQKKFRQLLIPYFIFAAILCFGDDSYIDWINIIYASRDSLAMSSCFTPLWFLPCFFVSTIVLNVINSIKNTPIRHLLFVLVGLLGFILSAIKVFSYGFPFNLDVALVGVLLMFLGGKFVNLLINKYILGGVFLIIGSLLCFSNLPQSLTPNNPHVEMAIGSFGNIWIFLVVALFITTGILSLSKLFFELRGSSERLNRITLPFTKPVLWIGKNSISVLCIHGIFISILIKLFSVISLPINHNVMAIIICLMTLLISYPVTSFIYSYAPNILGRR